MRLAIAREGIDSIPEANALIHEAADWLIAKGEPLWGPEETSFEELEQNARGGALIMARIGLEAAACMYLQAADILFWPDDMPGEALYIHRLAVARKFAGLGYAHAMLAWGEAASRNMGCKFVRLDCEPRPKLLELYRKAGFRRVDPQPIQVGRHFVVRHEKQT